jgi:hypothetical protein
LLDLLANFVTKKKERRERREGRKEKRKGGR